MKLTFKNQLALLAVFTLILGQLKTWSQTRPNIIVILTDDMGYADIGFNNGAADIASPNIDALANAGTIFTSAYVAHPFCGPSRTALLTGRYPHKIGAQYNLSDTEYNKGVDLNETFFSNVIKTSGYKTGAFGKWHLGQSTAHQPNSRGFDYFYGMLTGGHNYFTTSGGTAAYALPLRKNYGLANEAIGAYITDLFSDEAVTFIQNAESNDGAPFFMYVAYNAPHEPMQALQSDMDILAAAPYNFTYTTSNRQKYAAMVYSVDRGVKKIVDALKANGEYNDTLIVFLSDNGGIVSGGNANNGPLKGNKGDTYEGGYRVPMMMHWPNHIPAGVKYDYVVSSLDFYPTFVNLAGATIPTGKKLDGKDIYNNIVNNTNPRAGESIFVLRHRALNNVGIRRDQWKAYSSGDGTWQLYNLNTDIGETTNLADSNQSLLNTMVSGGYQWSRTNIDALFFDSTAAENTWNSNNLPDYPKTFTGYTVDLSVPKFLSNQLPFVYLYPNPAAYSNLSIGLNFEPTDAIDIYIYDVLGRPVQIHNNAKIEVNNEVQLQLNSNIQNGTYFVRVVSGENSFSQTLIVKR
ncbi:sulfatase-like hydrolase/transferase [Flavobacterium ovatum]|uniref:sulfatase-like hydrolase/transferase n=1 Tax=Flavobacterium ovatum TaxID=1928857 RepID=UPI00344E7AB7